MSVGPPNLLCHDSKVASLTDLPLSPAIIISLSAAPTAFLKTSIVFSCTSTQLTIYAPLTNNEETMFMPSRALKIVASNASKESICISAIFVEFDASDSFCLAINLSSFLMFGPNLSLNLLSCSLIICAGVR